MRIMGWILTVFGWVWVVTGISRVLVGLTRAMPGSPGVHIAMGIATLCLAWLAIWGGGKLRARARTKAAQSGV
jgi:hypothetical protein